MNCIYRICTDKIYFMPMWEKVSNGISKILKLKIQT